MSLFPLGLISQGGGAGGAAAFELISTQVLASTATSVTFSSLPSTYKHLQLRLTTRSNGSADTVQLRLNGDTTNNYTDHYLQGNGTTVTSGANTIPTFSGVLIGTTPASTDTANVFAVSISEILDFGSTSKNKTIKALYGSHSTGYTRVLLRSGMWNSTAAVTSLTILNNAGASFAIGSRFSLYGIVG